MEIREKDDDCTTTIVLLLLLLLLLSLIFPSGLHCALKEEPGPCKALKPRYYFNIDSGSCEMFDYGGCKGNDNNFLTKEECEETCVVSGTYHRGRCKS
uniref:BPTI/Kunitz inhibitor domain-containing protein n=1 Tax=Periophthalmus magnuspinnatus TaxID=409849 RepID=A0A3B4BBH2_9GOBI